MSFTLTREAAKKTEVFGSVRTVFGTVLSDATSGIVAAGDLGLKYIFGLAVTPKSCATGGFNVRSNAVTAAAASNGSINIMSCASGDEFYIVVHGR